ncbi:alpha hydrolase [Patescibacteria group bacterium]
MKVSILFSGGKDSSLVAILLSKIFEIELITCSFGILSNWKKAEKAAEELGFPFKVLKLNKEIIREAASQAIKDGFPNNGIKHLHKEALKEVAKSSKIIADGITRNDRVPAFSFSEIISFEDKLKVYYIQPLIGYSRKAINLLAEKYFTIKEYESNSFVGAEYEFELREVIRNEYSAERVSEIFPQNHTHSIITKVKNFAKN